MKKIYLASACLMAAAAMVLGCSNANKKKAAEGEDSPQTEIAIQDSIAQVQEVEKQKTVMEKLATLPEEPVFEIVTNLGSIKVKLYKGTPKHRDNFAKLALEGFYDGLLFHRVINGFMIQGGDPLTKDSSEEAVARYGTGGPGYTIPAEFVSEYKHKKGALAAARRGDAANPYKESSGSQFYIVQSAEACAQLDGDYTVFGETVSGLDVIDRIAQVATDRRDRPIKDVRIKEVKLSK